MSVIGSNILAGASGQGGGYNLTRSLRFRSSASASLSRTYSTTRTSGQKMTYSAWIKRGTLSGSAEYALFSAYDGSPASGRISFSNDRIAIVIGGSSNNDIITTAVYRDPSAWYHIVVGIDTTQATNTNRVKLYVNGVQVTAFGTTNYPTQNSNFQFLYTGANNRIAVYGDNSGGYFDGYMAEVNVIDGQQLDPSSFGEFSTKTGVWQPKRYSGTYGTNGFYLPFTDNSALTSGSNAGLGKDFSGNGNYWNTNNISITSGATYDSMTDVPTLTSATTANFAVINATYPNNGQTITNGNLQISASNQSTYCPATIASSSGKFYFETTIITFPSNSDPIVGIADSTTVASYSSSSTFSAYMYISNTYIQKQNSGTNTNTDLLTPSVGDTIMIAYDLDNSKFWIGKNGTWANSGNPSTGANPAFTLSSGVSYVPVFRGTGVGNTSALATNFGQRPFAYTPPTGYVALNTYNLPTPTIGATASSQANKYFDATTFTGTGSTQNIVNSGSFQPDFVWGKSRSAAFSHNLYDVLRGATKILVTDATSAESTVSTGLTSFNSNGFTLGTDGNLNGNGQTSVAWQWKANGTGVTNTAGSITSTVSANTTSGFSVVTYTGTGANATVGHGLGVAPKLIFIKRRNSTSDWSVYYNIDGLGAGVRYLLLNSTADGTFDTTYWNSTAATSTVFSLGTNGNPNTNTGTYVAYCFSEVAGYSKFGSYTGNGSTDGPFVYTGFRPRFILIKNYGAVQGWCIVDTATSTYNLVDNYLQPNSSAAQGSGYAKMDILSNGFKLRDTDQFSNGTSAGYIYAAFAENPFKYSLAR